MDVKKLYISGPISGDPDHYEKFYKAECYLAAAGYTVLNPTIWEKAGGLQALEYEDYMKLDFAMLEICDAIVMLPGWENSPGAKRERARAEELGLLITVLGENNEEGKIWQ